MAGEVTTSLSRSLILSRPVIGGAVDLRGHGLSDAPRQNYAITALADDLAWISEERNIQLIIRVP